jgi:hypothetical protein
MMKLLGSGIVMIAIGAGCSINGKAYGPTVTKPTPPSVGVSASSDAPTREPGTLGSGFEATEPGPSDGAYHKLPPYSSAPADPWVAVNGDQPKRWSEDDADHWVVRGNEWDCSAAHDHCLDKDAWFVVRDRDLERGPLTSATVHVFGPEGQRNGLATAANTTGSGTGDAYTAFRTVPATKTNMAVGSIVIGLSRDTPALGSGQHAVNAYWNYGIVEEVDFDVGVYKLKGARDTARLTGARVAVLSWHAGEKVKIIGGKKRDQLAVKAADVFLPDK